MLNFSHPPLDTSSNEWTKLKQSALDCGCISCDDILKTRSMYKNLSIVDSLESTRL